MKTDKENTKFILIPIPEDKTKEQNKSHFFDVSDKDSIIELNELLNENAKRFKPILYTLSPC